MARRTGHSDCVGTGLRPVRVERSSTALFAREEPAELRSARPGLRPGPTWLVSLPR
jgi:hypothetical protein